MFDLLLSVDELDRKHSDLSPGVGFVDTDDIHSLGVRQGSAWPHGIVDYAM